MEQSAWEDDIKLQYTNNSLLGYSRYSKTVWRAVEMALFVDLWDLEVYW